MILLLAAVALAFRKPAKKASPAMLRQKPLPEPATYIPPIAGPLTGTRPALHGVEGQYAGKSFSLEAGPSVLGSRSARIQSGLCGRGEQYFETPLHGELGCGPAHIRPSGLGFDEWNVFSYGRAVNVGANRATFLRARVSSSAICAINLN